MRIPLKTYYPGNSPVHRADARLKIAFMALFSLGLFLVHSLPGMLACALVLLCLALLSKVPARMYIPFVPTALVFGIFPVFANGLSFDVYAAADTLESFYGVGGAALSEPLVLFGTFGLLPAGILHGLVLGLRIVLLIAVSLLFTFTTESNDVLKALQWTLRPLGRAGLPVRDVATVLSLAMRFIPLIASELCVVADAHRSRASALDEGGFVKRLRAWGRVFIPLFVRLFRRADAVGVAMDARCYGASDKKQL